MLDAKKVDELISEFEHTPAIELQRLIDMARELASQHYWYCKVLADVARLHRTTRAARKGTFARLVASHTKTTTSNAAAKAEAEVDEEYRELYRKEYEYEGREKAGNRICDAIRKVLERMNQEIADLRKEKEYTRLTERT